MSERTTGAQSPAQQLVKAIKAADIALSQVIELIQGPPPFEKRLPTPDFDVVIRALRAFDATLNVWVGNRSIFVEYWDDETARALRNFLDSNSRRA